HEANRVGEAPRSREHEEIGRDEEADEELVALLQHGATADEGIPWRRNCASAPRVSRRANGAAWARSRRASKSLSRRRNSSTPPTRPSAVCSPKRTPVPLPSPFTATTVSSAPPPRNAIVGRPTAAASSGV